MKTVKILPTWNQAASVLAVISLLIMSPVTGPGRSTCPPETLFLDGTPSGDLTMKWLLTAWQGETTASIKYAAWAWKAREEGYPRIALLFSAISNSEHIHAKNHQAVILAIGGSLPEFTPRFRVRTSVENLREAIAGESHEIAITYPEFMAVANSEGNKLALDSFNRAYKAEIKHKAFFEEALAALVSGDLTQLPGIYSVCQVCGNTYTSAPPQRCAICSSPPEKFLQVAPL